MTIHSIASGFMERFVAGAICLAMPLMWVSANARGDQPEKADNMSEAFIIGVFWAPPREHTNEQHYDYLKDAHINLVPTIHPTLNLRGNVEERVDLRRRILDLAHERGMKVAVTDPRIYSDVQAVVQDYDHPGLGGYYLRDEPRRGDFERYGQIYRQFLHHDPERIPFVNMYPSAPDAMRRDYYDFLSAWINTVGPDNLTYLLFDNYPFACLETFGNPYYGRGRSHGNVPDYFNDLEVVRELGLEYGIKTGLYLQSVGIQRYLRTPDENDLRWNVYTALAYGIKNIQWFTWWTPVGRGEPFTRAIIDPEGEKTDLYEPVRSLNAQVTALGPVLMRLNAVAVYHSGVIPDRTRDRNIPEVPEDLFFKPADPDNAVLISHMIDQETGRQYVMAVNKDNRSLIKHADNLVLDGPKELKFTVSGGITELGRISAVSGDEVPVDEDLSDGVFSDSFLPGEGKLYVLPDDFR